MMFLILEVAIGLCFTYVVLSLVVSTANELVASTLRRRQKMLRAGIENLLSDKSTATKMYDHPLVKSLRRRNLLPSYIPARTFTLALLDMAAPAAAGAAPAARAAAIRAALQSNPSPLPENVTRTLMILLGEAGDDMDRFRANVEQWFNDAMDRVGGWYKRATQAILLCLALLLTMGTNADSVAIVRTLWRDPAVRTALVAEAEAYVKEEGAKQAKASQDVATSSAIPPPAMTPDEQELAAANFEEALGRLEQLSLPLGWALPCPAGEECDTTLEPWPGFKPAAWSAAFRIHWGGWILTAVAVSLGAPFWFDFLSKAINLRSSGGSAKPEEQPQAAGGTKAK